MNFDYSYRAFLITSLIFGCLFLILYSVKLGNPYPIDESAFDVEYIEDEPLAEEELAQLNETERTRIETNRAFNEAEKFIKEIENSSSEAEEKLNAMDEAIDAINGSNTTARIRSAKEKLAETRKRSKEEKTKLKGDVGTSRNTTISYYLPNRRSIYLPNPVYTCNGGGTIVINVNVNALGKVIKTDFNRRESTTQNGCLIESALKYAARARFNTAAATDKQKGTISYNFPGQIN